MFGLRKKEKPLMPEKAAIYGPATEEEKVVLKSIFEVRRALLSELTRIQRQESEWWDIMSKNYGFPRHTIITFNHNTHLFSTDKDLIQPMETLDEPEPTDEVTE